MLVSPKSRMLEKVVTSQFFPRPAFFAKRLLNFGLSGDSGMVGSGNPNDGMSQLSGSSYEDVLNGVVQNVTHGQNAGHVRRWDHD